MVDNFYWYTPFRKVLLYLIPWLLVGWLFDQVLLFIVIGLVGIILYQYYYQWRLYTWLWRERSLTPPSAKGTWGGIFDGIYKLQNYNRKRRKQLSSMFKRFREGSEAMPDATLVFDEHNTILWSNKLALQLLGFKHSDVGQRLNNLLRNPEFEKYQQKGEFSEPLVISSPLNLQVLLEIRIIPYADNQKLFIARDVTKIKQLESMRQDFVANVSHELRTPLTVLQGYLEMISDGNQMPAAMLSKAGEEMSTQTARMKELIDQLLTLSRIESAAEDILEKTIDSEAMLAQIRAEAEAMNENSQHQLEFEIDAGISIYGVEGELRSAMSNLLLNAMKYTPDGGVIKISWKMLPSGAEFAVTDNGPGIATKHLSRLTERFYRVDGARSRETGGSGLGLAIVKHVLLRHYSELYVTSQLDKGSRFSFVIPQNLIAEKL